MNILRIATRKSKLALWQARHVAELLENHYPDLKVTLVPLSTRGDEILDRSLAKIGGKGLFIKELEEAMLREEADLAVHSMKDVPGLMPKGFCITAVLERAQPFDALVSHARSLHQLVENAVVGTSSLRRAAQILSLRPDLQIKPIRGNVETRLNKWKDGEFDAIVLAEAGLARLGLEQNITQVLSADLCVPAVGQGIIGVECLVEQSQIREMLAVLDNHSAAVELHAERSFNKVLGGDCQSPIAAFARFQDTALTLTGLVAAADGRRLIRAHRSIEYLTHDDMQLKMKKAAELGEILAQEALSLGADSLLA